MLAIMLSTHCLGAFDAGGAAAAAAGRERPPPDCCHSTTVMTDLNQPDWEQQLLAAGFNQARPTVWVAEGLVYYLQPEAAKELLQVRGPLMAAALG